MRFPSACACGWRCECGSWDAAEQALRDHLQLVHTPPKWLAQAPLESPPPFALTGADRVWLESIGIAGE